MKMKEVKDVYILKIRRVGLLMGTDWAITVVFIAILPLPGGSFTQLKRGNQNFRYMCRKGGSGRLRGMNNRKIQNRETAKCKSAKRKNIKGKS